MSSIVSGNEITKSFEMVLENLSDKEQLVVEKRIGVNGERETLQSIGNSFEKPITRERVRQIENSGIKKIGRVVKSSILGQIQEKALELIDMHGGVMLRYKIVNTIIQDLQISNDVNANIIEIVIQSDFEIVKSKPKNGTQTFFYKQKISPKLILAIHAEALKVLRKKKDVMEMDDLYSVIQNKFSSKGLVVEKTLIDSSLEVFEDIIKGEEILIGLTRWKILNPKTLKDKTIYVMNKEKFLCIL
ncbi:MAG: sigma factor-like helix-turn-helix DNA-binding protein [Candidatus Gracilibacteria bacterium]|nr:sigma factor-like helix-turn-helix DNA-binding protein [Candidatus Gracilibacteria bacterium]